MVSGCDLQSEREAKLLDRVQKLLALAGSPNPHEATLAAGQAAKLIARHKLDASRLETPEPDPEIKLFEGKPLDASKRLRGWKIALASVLAQVNDCRILVTGPKSGQRHGVKDKERKIWVVGRPFDAMRLFAMYPPMLRWVEHLTMQKLSNAGHRYREDFRKGVVMSMAKSMQSMRLASWAESWADPGDPSDQALELAKEKSARRGEQVEQWMQARLGVRKGKGRSLSVILDAYQAGQEAGAELSTELLQTLRSSTSE